MMEVYPLSGIRLNALHKTTLQQTADLVTFTEEILNGKLHFCAATPIYQLLDYCFMISVLAENLKQYKLKMLSMA